MVSSDKGRKQLHRSSKNKKASVKDNVNFKKKTKPTKSKEKKVGQARDVITYQKSNDLETKRKRKKKGFGEEGSLATKVLLTVEAEGDGIQFQPSKNQAQWFNNTFRAVLGPFISSLEQGPVSDGSIIELSKRDHSLQSLSWHTKDMIKSWKVELCGAAIENVEAAMEAGSPVILIICSSAIRCVDFLRSLRDFTSKCKAAKLFAKHIKMDEQIKCLKGRVNIAAGTPNRIKKLIDLGALGMSRVSVVLFDLHKDAKGLTLFTVPEVREEFWELYKTHIHQAVVDNRIRICLY